jgi:hypothetical protein
MFASRKRIQRPSGSLQRRTGALIRARHCYRKHVSMGYWHVANRCSECDACWSHKIGKGWDSLCRSKADRHAIGAGRAPLLSHWASNRIKDSRWLNFHQRACYRVGSGVILAVLPHHRTFRQCGVDQLSSGFLFRVMSQGEHCLTNFFQKLRWNAAGL